MVERLAKNSTISPNSLFSICAEVGKRPPGFATERPTGREGQTRSDDLRITTPTSYRTAQSALNVTRPRARASAPTVRASPAVRSIRAPALNSVPIHIRIRERKVANVFKVLRATGNGFESDCMSITSRAAARRFLSSARFIIPPYPSPPLRQ